MITLISLAQLKIAVKMQWNRHQQGLAMQICTQSPRQVCTAHEIYYIGIFKAQYQLLSSCSELRVFTFHVKQEQTNKLYSEVLKAECHHPSWNLNKILRSFLEKTNKQKTTSG